VLTWNIRKCRGTDNVRDCGRVADWIARSRADVALLSAVHTLDDAEAIRQRLSALDPRRTWSMHYGKAETEGQVILSTYAMPPDERAHLVVSVADCGGTAAQIIVESAIDVAGNRVRLFAVDHEHSSEAVRQCQSRIFREWADRFDGVRIVGGDFNASPGDAGLAAWLAPQGSRIVHDAWTETPAAMRTGYGKEDAGRGNASGDPTFGRTRRTRIDHILFAGGSVPVRAVGASLLDTRDPATSCRDVKQDGFLGKCDTACVCAFVDDKAIRPSDHIPLLVTLRIF
jgi:endonuclease/exonuclease/phosphatase family metal-dependent hydrolase